MLCTFPGYTEKEPNRAIRNEMFNSLFLKTVIFVIHNHQ